MTSQEADEALWLGKRVKQVAGIPELIGRVGLVVEIFIDENDVLHCLCDSVAGGFWCPVHLLRIES
jgi:hypothetical protein